MPSPTAIDPKPVIHFIITRFNLRPAGGGGARQIDPVYLGERLDLFERFCLPTVRGQTRQDFTWLVLFDEGTPPVIRDRIAGYAEWPNFVPVYLPAGSEHVGRLVVSRYLDNSPRTLMTTRLDNDDGLCRSYVADIRRHVGNGERTVLQFPVGYVWNRDRVYLDRQERNAFTTLVEPLERGGESDFMTIYKGSHSDIHKLGRLVDVNQEPAWLQVIHGSNVENYVRGVRHRIGDLTRRFDVALPARAAEESGQEIALDRLRIFATSTATRLVRSVKFRLGRRVD